MVDIDTVYYCSVNDALQIHLSSANATSIVAKSKHVTASIVDCDGVYEQKMMNDE
jgi:hypothetical protein